MGLFTKKPRPLAVRYEAKATDGGLDQVLTMTNSTDHDLVPVLRFRPLDFYGRELPLVNVTSLQGLTRGQVVVPSNSATRDVLRFDGPGCRSVRFVDTEVLDLVEIEVLGLESQPTTVMVDLDKKATANPKDFWGVGVANANEAEMQVRVTLIELEPEHTDPKLRDAPRQALDWVSLEGDVTLAAKDHDVVWLPEDVRGKYHGVLGSVAAPPLD
ncbi:hypothetical protein [Aeromicrobium sp. Leaf350]|uniref:hypothetical protein n=1 Tax=Aeromicrobium sp. Leaf350 TaxID=2876565 RepID=UPI001E3E4356|nr:hypothetical protein [Aeromicrobium sp. Leaf350]